MGIEFCQGVAPVPQPHPAKNPGGDCATCSLTAGLRWLYPEKEIPFEEVWTLYEADLLGADPPKRKYSPTWNRTRTALYGAAHRFDLELEAGHDCAR